MAPSKRRIVKGLIVVVCVLLYGHLLLADTKSVERDHPRLMSAAAALADFSDLVRGSRTGQEKKKAPSDSPKSDSANKLAQLKPMHQTHVTKEKMNCTDCHKVAEKPAKGHELSFSVRPEHNACDRCHSAEFDKGELIPLCMVCHVGKESDLSLFPSGKVTIVAFSHVQHLDSRGRVNQKTGLRQDCVFCHEVDRQTAQAQLASHPQCADCHAGANPVRPVLAKSGGTQQCLACHVMKKMDENIMANGQGAPSVVTVAYREASYKDVVKFPHGEHTRDLKGSPIQCTVCHESVLQNASMNNPSKLPMMTVCTSCHESSSRVGEHDLIGKCQVCHTTIRMDLRPGDHEWMTTTTIAHTPSFRRNHEVQARASDTYCSYCHNMTRVTGNACANCHSVMRPRTHLAARFEETLHGRLAAMSRETCATCHEVNFCNRCHNIPPRSHAPLPFFAAGLHRDLARLNLRSCFACHTFEATCSRCHDRRLSRPPT